MWFNLKMAISASDPFVVQVLRNDLFTAKLVDNPDLMDAIEAGRDAALAVPAMQRTPVQRWVCSYGPVEADDQDPPETTVAVPAAHVAAVLPVDHNTFDDPTHPDYVNPDEE